MRKLLTLLLLLPVPALGQSDFEETRSLAEQGNPLSQYELGVIYATGKGGPENSAEAVKWYRLAAEQGHVEAQYNLGIRYSAGVGISKNLAESLKWHRLAAAQGDTRSQQNLGNMYFYGRGVPEDSLRAYTWFSVVAAQGVGASITNRDTAADNLTPQQLATGQKLAAECIESGFKDCPF